MKVSKSEMDAALGRVLKQVVSPTLAATVPVESVADIVAAAVTAITAYPPATVEVNAPVTVEPAPINFKPVSWTFQIERNREGFVTSIKATPNG